MRTLQIALVGVALLIASAAYADRAFSLDGTATFRAPGARETWEVSGTLTLFDAGTYTLSEEGDVSSGIWLEERNKIQLFQEAPTISEFIAEIEEAVNEGAPMEISVTSIRGRQSIKINRNGDITVRASSTYTFRPEEQEVRRPLRITVSERLVGVLQQQQ